MTSPRLAVAIEQIEAARKYSLNLLSDIATDEWFAMPGGVTHLAWQTGHLSMAEFRMCVARIRDEQPDDAVILPPEYLTMFGQGKTPSPEPSTYPSPAELLATLDRVHQASMQVCATLNDSDLDATVLKPHPLFNTKLGSLLWCSRHEMVHAGQIGLLRRLLGKKPQW